MRRRAPTRGVARIVRYEYERFDGSGYPDSLAGEAIPVGSRIILALRHLPGRWAHRWCTESGRASARQTLHDRPVVLNSSDAP